MILETTAVIFVSVRLGSLRGGGDVQDRSAFLRYRDGRRSSSGLLSETLAVRLCTVMVIELGSVGEVDGLVLGWRAGWLGFG